MSLTGMNSAPWQFVDGKYQLLRLRTILLYQCCRWMLYLYQRDNHCNLRAEVREGASDHCGLLNTSSLPGFNWDIVFDLYNMAIQHNAIFTPDINGIAITGAQNCPFKFHKSTMPPPTPSTRVKFDQKHLLTNEDQIAKFIHLLSLHSQN